MEDDNNIKSFLESEGYIEFKADAKCPTQALYDTYVRWCQDNAEKPVVTSTFSQYLKDNAEDLNIRRNKNIPNNEGKRVRGYEGIHMISEHDFRPLPDGYKTAFD